MAGVFGCALIILGSRTMFDNDCCSDFNVIPAITDTNSFESTVSILKCKEIKSDQTM